MKRVIITIIGSLVLLAGLSFVCYPFISNYLMEQNQSSEILNQNLSVNQGENKNIEKALIAAREYNKRLLSNVMLSDPFNYDSDKDYDKKYYELLNMNGNGVMGSIEIPKINVKLPIYHGTSTRTLEKGIGHLQKTSLPVGGKSTHAVLTGHSGLSTSRLFTDLEQLSVNDIFFIYVLNQKLAYKVDSIKVVLPTEINELKVVNDKDYVTLVTCTPYGKNTHRLLVRGERTDYYKAKEIADETKPAETIWMMQYKKALMIGLAILLIIISVFFTFKFILKNRKSSIKNNG